MNRELKKLLYCIRRDDYKDDAAVISKGISDLESLTKLSIRLEPSRRKQSGGRVFKVLRDLSTSMYRSLCSSIFCTHHHEVALELFPRISEYRYRCKDEIIRKTQFTIMMSPEMTEDPATKRLWNQVLIKAVTSDTAIDSKACLPQPQAKRIKGVVFDISQILSSLKPSKSTHRVESGIEKLSLTVADFSLPTACPEGGQKQPVDLCMALRNAKKEQPISYGSLFDTECADREFKVYPLVKAINSDYWSEVTLDDILEGKKELRPLVSLAEKVQLALTIALSVLQLSKTPWLPGTLTKRNVYCFRREDSISYEYRFHLRTCPASSVKPPSTAQGCSYENNPTLFALGILLLEIILGQSFEQLRSPFKQINITDPHGIIHDSIAAHKLLERVALINPAYQAIIQKCIDCTETRGLDDDDFRQEVYNDVVMELEAMVDSTKIGV